MKTPVLAFLLLTLFGCVTSGNYKVRRTQGMRDWGHILYLDRDHLARDVKRKCANALWDSTTCEKELALLPPGGRLVFNVDGSTKQEASCTNYEYVILDSAGRELLRQKGSDREPQMTTDQYGNTRWYTTDYLAVPFIIKAPFRVLLINNYRVRRSEFLVKAK
jgi:hypothetical protein